MLLIDMCIIRVLHILKVFCVLIADMCIIRVLSPKRSRRGQGSTREVGGGGGGGEWGEGGGRLPEAMCL